MPQQGVLLQIKGMGVPVQAPSTQHATGYTIRWSSDPEVPHDAPVHVLFGQQQVKRFLQLAVDPRFITADLVNILSVSVPDDCNSLSRSEAIEAGVSPDNWSNVRVALVIVGKSRLGVISDQMEWLGSRDDYASGCHMQEAFQHAQRRGITSPSIIPHTDPGHLLRAANFMEEFRRQYRPSLRASEIMFRQLQATLVDLDIAKLHPDRCKHYLREIQTSVQDMRNQQLINLDEYGMAEAELHKRAELDSARAGAEDQQTKANNNAPRYH